MICTFIIFSPFVKNIKVINLRTCSLKYICVVNILHELLEMSTYCIVLLRIVIIELELFVHHGHHDTENDGHDEVEGHHDVAFNF